MTVIVGVHGVGNYQPELGPAEAAAKIGVVWTTALAKSAGDGYDLSMAYYAHRLQRGVQQGLDDNPDTLDDAERAMLVDWYAALRGAPEPAQGWFTLPPRQLLGAIADSVPGGNAVGPFMVGALRELRRYFGDEDRRVKARDDVAKVIADRSPSIVLAHSLGSVVAYEALWANPDLPVDLFVTVGSPLAIRGTVFDRLVPTPPTDGRKAPKPPGVRRWANLADPGDLCAVPRWLSRAFDVDPDREAPIGVFKFHGVARYLACAELAEILRGA